MKVSGPPVPSIRRGGPPRRRWSPADGGNIPLSGLINEVLEQAVARLVHLPQGMVHELVIDVRGQLLTDEIRRKILKDISSKANGIIKASNIRFIEK